MDIESRLLDFERNPSARPVAPRMKMGGAIARLRRCAAAPLVACWRATQALEVGKNSVFARLLVSPCQDFGLSRLV